MYASNDPGVKEKDMDKVKKMARKRKPRKRSGHGGYAYLTSGAIPETRQYVKKYLTNVREGLIRDIGPTEKDLTTAQLILVDRIVSLLGIIRLIEEKAREDGVVFKGQDLTPSLRQSYISYNNTMRLTLRELGIDKRVGDGVQTLEQIIAESEKKGKEKKGG